MSSIIKMRLLAYVFGLSSLLSPSHLGANEGHPPLNEDRYSMLFQDALVCAEAADLPCVEMKSREMNSREFSYLPRYEVYLLDGILGKQITNSKYSYFDLFLVSILVDANVVSCEEESFVAYIGPRLAGKLSTEICAEYYLPYYDQMNSQKSARLFRLLATYAQFKGSQSLVDPLGEVNDE